MYTYISDWKIPLFEGILMIIFGGLALLHPVITSISLAVLLGILLLAIGLVVVTRAIRYKTEKNYLINLISGILIGLFGFLMIVSPLAAVFTLTGLVACYFVLDGILRLVALTQLPAELRSGWLLLSGLLSLTLAILVWASWPEVALWFLGLLVGIQLIFAGVSLIVLALAIKEFSRR